MRTIAGIISLSFIGCCSALAFTNLGNGVYQSNGSSSDTQAAINSAPSGGTVIVPNGTWHWSSAVVLDGSKVVHLLGQTKNGVLIINDDTSGSPLDITEALTGSVEVANLNFFPGAADGPNCCLYDVTGGGQSGGQPILLHDCTFWSDGGQMIYTVLWTVNGGVIYNCTFDSLGNFATGIEFARETDDDWKNPSTFGTADTNGTRNTYIEDCTFKTAYIGCSDMADEARVVWRHDHFLDSSLYSHGQDSSPYGVRQWEFYICDFTQTQSGTGSETVNGKTFTWTYPLNLQSWFTVRGGTGIFHDNQVADIIGKHKVVELNIYAISQGGNQLPCITQYPCPRQVGQGWIGAGGYSYPQAPVDGTGYDTEPIALWNNTVPGVGDASTLSGYVSTNQPNDTCGNGQLVDNYVKLGRDYVLTQKAGYTPFTYPHPLRTGGSPPPPPPGPTPPPPQNLRIVP